MTHETMILFEYYGFSCFRSQKPSLEWAVIDKPFPHAGSPGLKDRNGEISTDISQHIDRW